MSKTHTWALTTPALERRALEIRQAILRLDNELERVEAVLRTRTPARTRPSGKRRKRAQHGTDSGYTTHRKRWHTPPCDACKDAHSAAKRARAERRQAP